MLDRAFLLTWQAVRRQLAAMPQDLYLVRLIHQASRKAFPGERLWTSHQLLQEATLRFLRIRNREGCDVYIQPYAENRNAGYILLDLDQAEAVTPERMQAQGHEPCVVLETSPGHRQAWIRVSAVALETGTASVIAKQLARLYRGDLASAEGRHLGRLAGFTNQKPQRRQCNGYAPWVRVLHARIGLATAGAALVEAANRQLQSALGTFSATPSPCCPLVECRGVEPSRPPATAREVYQNWLLRLHIPHRFPQPDWSIADKWIAKEWLRHGTPVATVAALLQAGSPDFPRLHAHPQDYLRRTIARALHELAAGPFSPPPPHCVDELCPGHFHAPLPADGPTGVSS